jgi:hypothetical protein
MVSLVVPVCVQVQRVQSQFLFVFVRVHAQLSVPSNQQSTAHCAGSVLPLPAGSPAYPAGQPDAPVPHKVHMAVQPVQVGVPSQVHFKQMLQHVCSFANATASASAPPLGSVSTPPSSPRPRASRRAAAGHRGPRRAARARRSRGRPSPATRGPPRRPARRCPVLHFTTAPHSGQHASPASG